MNRRAIKHAAKFFREKVSKKFLNMGAVIVMGAEDHNGKFYDKDRKLATPEMIVKKLKLSIVAPEKVTCGAAGCFFGYFPVMFSRTWKPTKSLDLYKHIPSRKQFAYIQGIAKQLEVSEDTSAWIADWSHYGVDDLENVTPIMVARKLEHLLAVGERIMDIDDVAYNSQYCTGREAQELAKKLKVGVHYKGKRWFSEEDRKAIDAEQNRLEELEAQENEVSYNV